MGEQTAIEELVARLRAEGWKQHRDGMIYINGSLGTNLLKDGQVLSLQLELYPDEELVTDGWAEG